MNFFFHVTSATSKGRRGWRLLEKFSSSCGLRLGSRANLDLAGKNIAFFKNTWSLDAGTFSRHLRHPDAKFRNIGRNGSKVNGSIWFDRDPRIVIMRVQIETGGPTLDASTIFQSHASNPMSGRCRNTVPTCGCTKFPGSP